MSERDENTTPKEEIVYASPVKRAWAWVGVAYMVIATLLMTYAFARGEFLQGIGGLMLCPALCGLGATAILRYRAGTGKGGLPACILLIGAALALLALNLITGIPALLNNF